MGKRRQAKDPLFLVEITGLSGRCIILHQSNADIQTGRDLNSIE
ncbi:hypothetical protein ACIQY5_07525 [Peribacillus frigoritolerans]|nr:hypothetical protein [Peribacillus frigoritolerans]MEB2491538.1 hypothetical protein [Peribacillus frigoritolerans]